MNLVCDNEQPIIKFAKEQLIGSYTEASPLGVDASLKSNKLMGIQSIHKSQYRLVKPVVDKIISIINKIDLNEIYFVTVRPSPEFVFMESGKIPNYEAQVNCYTSLFKQPGVDIISFSIEKGTKHTQILHYHLILHIKSKKSWNKWFTFMVNKVTVLHKVYGYQKAVLHSETLAHNLNSGVSYFNGISKNIPTQLKPDVYKHFVGNLIL